MSTRNWRDLLILSLAGLAIRLYFAPQAGHVADLSIFSHWATLAAANPWTQLYQKTNANYPPGAMLFFELVGRGYRAWVKEDPGGAYQRVALKLPAILFDVLGGFVTYALARRFVAHRLALAAAAIFVLNPAVIYDSAYWGQNDSITAVSALGAVALLIAGRREAAWCVLAFAVLNKPPVLVLAPLFALEPFLAPPAERGGRLRSTVVGIAAAFAVAYLIAIPFYANHNIVAVFKRLVAATINGSGLYPYNSANAFNVYALFGRFFEPDSTRVLGVPLKDWGYALFLAALVLVLRAYARRRTDRALLEASFLTMLGLFLFLTEMHERYLIYALTLIPVLAVLERRYLWSAGVLTLTQWLSLEYSMVYMWLSSTRRVPGLDQSEFEPVLIRLCSLANLGVFGVCGSAYVKVDAPAQEPSPS